MDYRVLLSRELSGIHPGIGIRPIGQKNHRNNQKAFEEALKEKEQEEAKEVLVIQGEKGELAGDLHEDGESENKGRNLNILA